MEGSHYGGGHKVGFYCKGLHAKWLTTELSMISKITQSFPNALFSVPEIKYKVKNSNPKYKWVELYEIRFNQTHHYFTYD